MKKYMPDTFAHLMDELMGEAPEVQIFEQKLASLVADFHGAQPEVQARLVSTIVTFASVCTARAALWHVKDHDGVTCAQEIVRLSALGFAETTVSRCKEIAEEEGIADPFVTSSTNEDLVKEMLSKSDT